MIFICRFLSGGVSTGRRLSAKKGIQNQSLRRCQRHFKRISIYRIEGQVFEKLIEKGVHIMASDGRILINGGVCHFEVRLQTEEPIQVVTQGEQQRNEHNRDND